MSICQLQLQLHGNVINYNYFCFHKRQIDFYNLTTGVQLPGAILTTDNSLFSTVTNMAINTTLN